MANFIKIKSNYEKLLINVDKIDYIEENGYGIYIYFGKEYKIRSFSSVDEIQELIRMAKKDSEDNKIVYITR